MFSRRRFLKFLGIGAGVAASGTAIAQHTKEVIPPPKPEPVWTNVGDAIVRPAHIRIGDFVTIDMNGFVRKAVEGDYVIGVALEPPDDAGVLSVHIGNETALCVVGKDP